jgi:hypothetical protein
MLLSTRVKRTVVALAATWGSALALAPATLAFSESYGPATVGNNGWIQSGGAHTFIFNEGAGSNGGQLACQLFNSKGVNAVTHGNGVCSEVYGGGQFVWARVYNESGVTETIAGFAET